MKRIITALLALGALAGVSGSALAADAYVPTEPNQPAGWYLRGDAGFSWMELHDGNTDGLVLGGGVGYQYNDNLRADLRADAAGVGSSDYMTSVLGNMYFDIPMDSVITPYLGAGAGYGWASGNENGFAFALMAGAELRLSDTVSADIGYRYRQIIDGNDPHDHEVLVGLRYKF